jgi:hypothetical protein
MRIAMMLAAAGITGKFPAMPAGLLAQGLKSLGGSEQLHDLTDQLRGEVLTAAKAATLAAATNRVDALNDRLQGVVPTEDVGRAAGSATRGLTAATGRGRRARDDDFDQTEDDQSDDPYGDEEPLDVEEEDLEDEDIDDEDTDDDEGFEDGDPEDDDLEDQDLDDDLEGEAGDDDDEPPPPRRRATRKAATPRTSARRSRTTAADRDGEPPKAPSRRGRASAATKRAPVRRGR